MSNQPEQNFSNHAKMPTGMMGVLILILLGAILSGVGAAKHESPSGTLLVGIGSVLVALTTMGGLLVCRTYSTGLQDRIIRTEMQLRLARVLPADQHALIPQLSISQLIALRFASDAELPALTQKVADENITDKKTIKQLVTDWQADHHRI